MLYHFAEYLSSHYDIPGLGMFNYLSFRAIMAIILSLTIAIIIGVKIIRLLQRKQIGEEVRNLGLQGQLEKKGTPTMGGLIILMSLIVPVLLFCDLSNVYIQLLLFSSVWLGIIGFLDDYIKVFKGKKDGLQGRFKIVGQVVLGLIVGLTMWNSQNITVREKILVTDATTENICEFGYDKDISHNTYQMGEPQKRTVTTIPFIKDNQFDYSWLVPENDSNLNWIVYVIAAILIITAVSNCANLTDGLDGLAAGVSASIVLVLGVLAYVSGNIIYAEYLDIMYIPMSGEMFVFAMALLGALIGFLWYNTYPAQVFMGDTGSLAIGGIIAVLALLIRKELLLPLLCGIFFVEGLSVIIQVAYFKYTKKKFGEGKRIFLMAPLHHHYQKRGFFEVKIVNRFWIIQMLLAAITLVTLKIR
ncbi:MAG: phospho-N-acetylmuramoyl-pentapeptide-transferase [Rikenellaceae bacterium]